MLAKSPSPFFLPRSVTRQPEIDTLLSSSENTETLIKYVELNPDAKNYLSTALYYLAHSEKNNLELAKMLLAAGADPNHISDSEHSPDYKSVLEAATANYKSSLVEILLESGAKTDLFVQQKLPPKELMKRYSQLTEEAIDQLYAEEAKKIFEMSGPEKTQDMIRRNKLPAQIAFRNYQEKIGENRSEIIKTSTLLSKKTISELGLESELTILFKKQYGILREEISKSFSEAVKNNKQFIIRIGEYHYGLSSLIIEHMVLLICKELGINTLLTEHNKYIERCIKKHGYIIPERANKWSVSLTINEQLNILKMHSIPVDLGHWGAKKIGDQYDSYEDMVCQFHSNFDNTSPEGIKYRNKVIRDVIVEGIKDHCILVVGSAHLYGLHEEVFFPETIEFLTINAEKKMIKTAISENNGKEHLYQHSLESTNILQTEEGLDEFCHYLSPEAIIEYVNKIHQEFQVNKNQDLLFFKKPYNPSTDTHEVLEIGTQSPEKTSQRNLLF